MDRSQARARYWHRARVRCLEVFGIIEDRMCDYEIRLGIERDVVLPQFSGWWSRIYLQNVQHGYRISEKRQEVV